MNITSNYKEQEKKEISVYFMLKIPYTTSYWKYQDLLSLLYSMGDPIVFICSRINSPYYVCTGSNAGASHRRSTPNVTNFPLFFRLREGLGGRGGGGEGLALCLGQRWCKVNTIKCSLTEN